MPGLWGLKVPFLYLQSQLQFLSCFRSSWSEVLLVLSSWVQCGCVLPMCTPPPPTTWLYAAFTRPWPFCAVIELRAFILPLVDCGSLSDVRKRKPVNVCDCGLHGNWAGWLAEWTKQWQPWWILYSHLFHSLLTTPVSAKLHLKTEPNEAWMSDMFSLNS